MTDEPDIERDIEGDDLNERTVPSGALFAPASRVVAHEMMQAIHPVMKAAVKNDNNDVNVVVGALGIMVAANLISGLRSDEAVMWGRNYLVRVLDHALAQRFDGVLKMHDEMN